MTRTTIIPIVIFAFASLLPNIAQAQADIEPPLMFELDVNGKTLRVQEGITKELDGTYVRPKITFKVSPHRFYSYGGVSFRYPRAYVFEADVADAGYQNWTMSGNDFKIMYFVLKGQLTTRDFLAGMVQQFGKENGTISDEQISLNLKDRRLVGSTLLATVAGQRVRVDVYAIPVDQSQTRLLVLQDSLGDSGERTDEGRATIDLLRASFQVSP